MALSKEILYSRWMGIKDRCKPLIEGSKFKNFNLVVNYAGRGITIQDSWKTDYKAFKTYMLSLYPTNLEELLSQKYQIDRIDNDGNYEEGNIRLVTCKENCNNTRKNKRYDLEGKKYTIYEIIQQGKSIIPEASLKNRLLKGWDIKEAISTPLAKDYFVIIEDREYSWKEVRKLNKLNLSMTTLRNRIKKQWSFAKIFNTPPKCMSKEDLEYVKTHNIHHLDLRLIRRRQRNGWTLEDSVNTPLQDQHSIPRIKS